MKNGHHCTLNGHTGLLLPAPGLRTHAIEIAATAIRNSHVIKLRAQVPLFAVLSVIDSGEAVALTTFSRS